MTYREASLKEWDDFDAMIVDIGKFVRPPLHYRDDPVSRHYDFTDGHLTWRVRISAIPSMLAKIEDPSRRELLRRAFATTAGRVAFANSVPKALRLQAPTRFDRDEPI